MSSKSARKKQAKETAKATNATKGFLVRKKYPESSEWNYFGGETKDAYLWTPASALDAGNHLGLAIFPSRLAAERMAERIDGYHKERRAEGKASGFDVSVEEIDLPPEASQAMAASFAK